jgi:hypothetical protein
MTIGATFALAAVMFNATVATVACSAGIASIGITFFAAIAVQARAIALVVAATFATIRRCRAPVRTIRLIIALSVLDNGPILAIVSDVSTAVVDVGKHNAPRA